MTMTNRTALHVAYIAANGREPSTIGLGRTTPEQTLTDLQNQGFGPVYDAAINSATAAIYKAQGVQAAVADLYQRFPDLPRR